MENLYPKSDGQLEYKALEGDDIVLKIVESKESRVLATGYELVYDVFLDPPREGIFTDYIDNKNISDEVIISWNVFDYAGWTFFNKTLVKKWPPRCTRVRHNEYKVTIAYAPLSITDFQVIPTTAKRKFGLQVVAFVYNDSQLKFNDAELPPAGFTREAIASRAINVDEEGKVQGIDVIEPNLSWTERWVWGPYNYLAKDNANYFTLMAELTGTINEEEFRGCRPGTVLFSGGTARNTQPMTWEIDYRYSFKPVKESQEFCGIEFDISPSFQSGWNFIDGWSPRGGYPVEILGREHVLPFPEIVKVHKVYPIRNFAALGVCPEIDLGAADWSTFIDDLPELDAKVECPVQPVEEE